MQALTLWRPWSELIARGIKRVENRTWSPRTLATGERFAIHAGLRWDADAAEWCDQYRVSQHPADHPTGIVAVVRLGRIIEGPGDAHPEFWPFYIGPIGWVLRDIRRVQPVAVRGAQGLWTVPDEIASRLIEEIG